MIELSGEQVRMNWRDTIDRVFKGETVIVLRYGKPVAVLFGYEEWRRFMATEESKDERDLSVA